MALSLMKGKRVTLSKVDAFADGVAVKQASRANLLILRCNVSIPGLSTRHKVIHVKILHRCGRAPQPTGQSKHSRHSKSQGYFHLVTFVLG